MLSLPDAARIYYCPTPVNLGRSYDGLCGAVRRFLDNPRLNIDNNPCENVIRPLCVGRKNWLFVGSPEGGRSMAVLASFAATCKDNGVNFEEWLLDVVRRLDTTPAKDIDCQLPHHWKAAREEGRGQGSPADGDAPDKDA